MATYGDSAREYPYSPPKRRKQKYSLVTRVIDFDNKPITSGGWVGHSLPANTSTTAWAATDVLQVIQIRAGQTVLGVQLEILRKSVDKFDLIQIGYGTDADRWGVYNLSRTAEMKDYPLADGEQQDGYQIPGLGEPVYFSTSDTIDIVINRAALAGKIRLIVHLLEDDR